MPTETTEDWLLNEQVRIIQAKTGYRAGLDAILLACALTAKPRTRILDLGCGAGGALFPAAFRNPEAAFTGLDRDALSLSLARRGCTVNQMEDRVSFIESDAANLPAALENTFDQVISNPPYFDPQKLPAIGEGKAHAYHAEVSLSDWLKAMLFATKPKGRITLVHRAGELGEIIAYLLSRSGEITVYPIFPAPGLPAKRVIVTARKGLRRGEVRLLPGLTLHRAKGDPAYTEEAEAILKGAALLP